jgi:hypothetical protein
MNGWMDGWMEDYFLLSKKRTRDFSLKAIKIQCYAVVDSFLR